MRKKFLKTTSFMLVTSLLLSLFVCAPTTAKAATSPRAGGAFYNYGEAMQKSILFYKANRLGDLPDNYVLPYRGDAAMTDGKDVGLDLTGGWADAGDGIKFTHPMSYAAGQLGWAVYEYRDAFEKSGQLDDILDEIKWATDFFIKAHPSPDVLYYMCGYEESDHSVWIPHELLDYKTDRKSFKVDPTTPGSDVAGQTAAALAIASIIFEPTDPTYAETCLTHAKQLFKFADTYRGKNPLKTLYPSGSYLDDLAWGAIWLYIKTQDSTYLDKAKSILPVTVLGGQHTHCWDDVSYGAALKIAQAGHDESYAAMVEKNLDYWMPGTGIKYTPGGLAWLSQWGSLRYATTAAFLAFVWSDDKTIGTASKKQAYHDFAERQVNYALGDNPRGGSYEVGFGENAPEHPHHRTAHGSWTSMLNVPTFHRHILYGALVGGPSSDDSWKDDIKDYTLNEVATDYNAGFVGCLAKMYGMYGGNPLVNWPKPEDFRSPQDNLTEYFTRGWIIYEGYGKLKVMFQINNRSAWPATMKDKMSTRYFMDLSEVFEAGGTVDDVQLTLEDSQGAKLIGLKQYKDNIYYFTVDFTGTQIMPAEWEMCEKDATVQIEYKNGAGSNQNDWSYQNLSGPPDFDAVSFAGMSKYIPVYDNGKLLWGEEPAGGIPEVKYGDINNDGNIDAIDFALLKKILMGDTSGNVNLAAADFNKDGDINAIDYAALKSYLQRGY
ncbi:glycoside hydrolase family 9 protein [Ruminiclostridium papyrosolvens]|uniref:Glucanase n=1 Tax=Ruminiclostridium papyrosolvens C7 TaxID=1330534 RepID=U4QYL7_9FIRM|nr:glycoside hydrolase family 9 protein [Ruminiclostridium papyrosolvens]EPR10025.1 glycoside hydrolase [Ruminiclostridium papyrosolvens C7]